MSEEKLIVRIRALLRLASNNPNEHEAEAALAKAQQMMTDHNITLSEEIEAGTRKLRIIKGGYHDGNRPEYWALGAQIAAMFQCKFTWIIGDTSQWTMAGEESAVEVATETMIWIMSQIDVFYKDALRGFGGTLTKSQRADLRKTFRGACAQRVAYRVRQITGSRSKALVLVTPEQIDEAIGGMRLFSTPKPKNGLGTALGTLAGETVQIRKGVQ